MMRPAIKIRGYRNTSSTFSDDGRFHIFENGIRKQMTPIYDDRVDPQSEQILLGHFAAGYLEYAFDRPLSGSISDGGIRYVIKQRQPFFGEIDEVSFQTAYHYRIIAVDSIHFGKGILTECVNELLDGFVSRLRWLHSCSEFIKRFPIPGDIASGTRLRYALSIGTIVKFMIKLKRLRNLVIERMYRPGERGYRVAASSWGEHAPATVQVSSKHAKRRRLGSV